MRTIGATMVALLLAGCGGGAAEHRTAEAARQRAVPPASGPPGGRAPADGTARPLATDAWIGRWTGPEGLFLDVADGGERGRYALTMKGDLDGRGDRLAGVAEGDTIRFVRGGKVETLRAGDGAATGLKWLAGRKDCLIVGPGEGYCRDRAAEASPVLPRRQEHDGVAPTPPSP